MEAFIQGKDKSDTWHEERHRTGKHVVSSTARFTPDSKYTSAEIKSYALLLHNLNSTPVLPHFPSLALSLMVAVMRSGLGLRSEVFKRISCWAKVLSSNY